MSSESTTELGSDKGSMLIPEESTIITTKIDEIRRLSNQNQAFENEVAFLHFL